MTRKVTSYRLPEMTLNQIKSLTESTGSSDANVIAFAIDRMFQQETQTMKTIKVGEVNDLHLYAVDGDDGRYYPLTKSDLKFQQPDAKIFYDSGLYPSITLEELPQYICDKARNI